MLMVSSDSEESSSLLSLSSLNPMISPFVLRFGSAVGRPFALTTAAAIDGGDLGKTFSASDRNTLATMVGGGKGKAFSLIENTSFSFYKNGVFSFQHGYS